MTSTFEQSLWVVEKGWVKRDRNRKVVAAGLGTPPKGLPSLTLNFHRRALITIGNTSELVPRELCGELVKQLQVRNAEATMQLLKIERLVLSLFHDGEPKVDRRGRYSKKAGSGEDSVGGFASTERAEA
jgi:hypothetical protein